MTGKYYHTKDSVQEYIKLAEGVDGKMHIEVFEKYLSTEARILEIGSGPGKDWKILSGRFNVTGSDNSAIFVSHLKDTYPNGDFLRLDAVSLATEEEYDAIYSNKVLHHLTDEDLTRSLLRQAAILKKNGLICHTFWKGEGSEEFKGMFVNYHLKNDLRNFFGLHFDVLALEEYGEFEEGDSLRLIAKKKK